MPRFEVAIGTVFGHPAGSVFTAALTPTVLRRVASGNLVQVFDPTEPAKRPQGATPPMTREKE